MNTNLIASFKIRTPFYNAVNRQINFLSALAAFIVFIMAFFLLWYIIGEAISPLGISFFLAVMVFIVPNYYLKQLKISDFDNSILEFYTDKLIIKENYSIKMISNSIVNLLIQNTIKHSEPSNKITEYLYTEITHFDIFHDYLQTRKNQKVQDNSLLIELSIGEKTEKIRLFVGNLGVIISMQDVLKHLYGLNMSISEGDSGNEETYLLYKTKKVEQKILNLIEEIGKDNQSAQNL
jgi:hypothetical protein